MNSLKPKKFATIGAVAGAITIILAWATKTFANIELTAEVAGAIQVVITYAAQHFAPEGSNGHEE